MKLKTNIRGCGKCRRQFEKEKLLNYNEFNNPNGPLCPSCAMHTFSPEKYVEKLNKVYGRALNKDRVNYFKSLII
jgi:hypothetical protein